MTFAIIPENEQWRINLLLNLLAVKNENLFVDDFNNGEISLIIDYVCTT